MSLGAESTPEVIVDHEAINELLTRGVDSVYPSPDALAEELQSGRQLSVYMGMDPTAPDMHVGHESQLLKLKRFQELGHNVTLLIGDFTGMIGDPTDRSAARQKLTRDEVLHNAEGYRQQAGKILDFENPHNPVRMRYNSEWLGKMSFADVVELSSEFTVQQMLERSMFRRRIEDGKPVGLHEFLYPLMQGYDSVAMNVDVEVGGSDQIFNMLRGSDLVRRQLGKQKYVLAGKMLADPSGRKIGKTEGNMITLNDDPSDMYQKIMRWGDGITPHALELCSQLPMAQVNEIKRQLEAGELSGLDGKKFLARTIIKDLHGPEAAASAEQVYEQVASKDVMAIDLQEVAPAHVRTGQNIIDILCDSGLASSRSAARRLLEGNAVRIGGSTVDAEWSVPADGDGAVVLQVGKRKLGNYRKLIVSDGKQQ